MASPAVHRYIMPRLKRYRINRTAFRAYNLENFALPSHALLSLPAALRTSCRLRAEAALGIKILLSGTEYKFRAAIPAYQYLILIHTLIHPFSAAAAEALFC